MTDSTDIRDALIAYTGDEPPLTFAYEHVLTAGRRARRRRRIAAAAGGSLVFVAVTGVFMAALPHVRADPDVSAGVALDPAPFCAAAEAEPSSPAAVEHAAARISCYLLTAVPPLLPEADFQRIPGSSDDVLPLQAYPSQETPPIISADALVSDSRGFGEIGFGLYPAAETVEEAIASCAGCDVRQGSHGETILVHEAVEESRLRRIDVWVHKGDTVVFATATNAVPDATLDSDKQEMGRPEPPLDEDQLVELATAPELTLFP
ncbi:hypothetical protein [Actinoplanes aureus]|uniref:Uncharacterized protein n=1 Tax=Actinoplanes aureus TaxID=2792083 RepID=A0A931CGV0_9ACTN|nr:hypothetical protein [Actinoplanes aureus]MBG0564670.1 hypothetical protein [Actinoplanes aureus]